MGAVWGKVGIIPTPLSKSPPTVLMISVRGEKEKEREKIGGLGLGGNSEWARCKQTHMVECWPVGTGA